ncbi:MAG: 4-hydroxy-3-methylbut-2-en-1-yl diphosphate synthase [Oscillospiraceae bacterium]|jgi:2-dehydro-3-deoxyglucarate aldolase/4-hydroxy-2-oxoheptanedioate aldolase|nr:4-hydroxy-3-methylbut-2-en-1-yl diphosphate synthase [Oscillospiraceae bacterium]
MNKSTELLRRMKSNDLVIGTHVNLADLSIAEQMGVLGFDFVWIEGEHSPLDKQTILGHIIAARAGGAASFVRIPWNDPVLAKPILEMGPDGIIFPFIRTADEARAAVAACRYPPKGIRGFGPRRANSYGTQPAAEYLEGVDASFLRIMQIEHIDAVNNLAEILAVDGVDTIVVGPNDLSGSIGLLGQTRHPDVMALMDKIGEVCAAAKVPFGVSMGVDEVSLADWVRRGAAWIGAGNDVGYIAQAGSDAIKLIKSLA